METEHDQIDLVRLYLERMRETVRDYGIFTRNASLYACDHVVFGSLSKAFSVADAALILVQNEHPDEAFGLVRSLVECAFNLRYLTQDRDKYSSRSMAFAKFYFKEHQFWLYQAMEFLTDPDVLAELDEYAKENGIVADSKAASEH